MDNNTVMTKVPAVTLGFWIIKIAATTLGETGGDTVTMTWLHADVNPDNGGYLIGSGIFLCVFVAAVVAQILQKKFNPWIYWLAIVASTTVGTAMADFADRSLGDFNGAEHRSFGTANTKPGRSSRHWIA